MFGVQIIAVISWLFYCKKLILDCPRQTTPWNKISPTEVDEKNTVEINLSNETFSLALSEVDLW